MIEAALRRDRSLVAGALALVTALAWAWTLGGAGMDGSAMDHSAISGLTATTDHGGMARHGGMTGSGPADGAAPVMGDFARVAAWTPGYALLMFVMWVAMMTAMMLPSAGPFILLAVAVHHRTATEAVRPCAGPAPATGMAGLMALGYLSVWAGFSVLATLAQWGLEETGLLSSTTLAGGAVLGGTILVAAGAYQFTAAKRACLRHCRSPVSFLTTHWRPGGAGAVRLGALHGAFCVGCCWLLMALLFAGGLMNPLWIGGIALYVLFEKFGARGEQVGRALGVVLVALGAVLLMRNL